MVSALLSIGLCTSSTSNDFYFLFLVTPLPHDFKTPVWAVIIPFFLSIRIQLKVWQTKLFNGEGG